MTCEAGNVTFECANTNRAVNETAGRVRSRSDGTVAVTEFSASNGPRTAGGTFPAVNDPWDDVASNPNHRWTRIIDAHLIAAAYGLGTLTSATTESDPTQPYDGVWDNRVRLGRHPRNRSRPRADTSLQLWTPIARICVRAVTRGVSSSTSMRLIGDSVGASITGGVNTELPALLDGVFTSATFDTVQNRCTSDARCPASRRRHRFRPGPTSMSVPARGSHSASPRSHLKGVGTWPISYDRLLAGAFG